MKIDYTVSLEKILLAALNADTGYVLKVDIKFTNHAKKFSLNFPFCTKTKNQSLKILTISKVQNSIKFIQQGILFVSI